MGKILQGVPQLGFGQGVDFTPIGALHAVLASLGLRATYEALMVLGGAAFKVHWNPDWTADAAHRSSEDYVGLAAAALGFQVESHVDRDLGDVWGALTGSIDAGVPALACGIVPPEEFTVVAGYADDPRRVYLRTYFDSGPGYREARLEPWEGWLATASGANALVVLQRVGRTRDEIPALREALERAVRHWNEAPIEPSTIEESPGTSAMVAGERAYTQWGEAIRSLPADEAVLKAAAFASALNLTALISGRRGAVAYFEGAKGRIVPKLHDLGTAADKFGRSAEALQDAATRIAYPFGLADDRSFLDVVERMADPSVRTKVAEDLERARVEDGWAMAALGRIAARLGNPSRGTS